MFPAIAPVSVNESVAGIIKYAHEISIEQSGCFIGFDGENIHYWNKCKPLFINIFNKY